MEHEITPQEMNTNDQDDKVTQQKMAAAKADLKTVINASTPDELLDQIIRVKDSDLLPWEEVWLPSRGIYYNGLIPDGLVRVRPMGAQDEKILATQRLAQTGQSIDYLFKKCVELPDGFDTDDLLVGDRIFLLYYLRGITHGNLYEFTLTCSNQDCGAKSLHTYDLNQLATTIKRPDPSIGTEPFKIVLPYMSESVGKEIYITVKFLRGKDTNSYMSRRKFKKRVTPGSTMPKSTTKVSSDDLDDTTIDTLVLSIDSFMGSARNKEKIRALVNKMHSRDVAVIRDFLRDNAPGIDTTIDIQCPECGNEYKTELPITEGFFRPARSGPAAQP